MNDGVADQRLLDLLQLTLGLADPALIHLGGERHQDAAKKQRKDENRYRQLDEGKAPAAGHAAVLDGLLG
jgi:arginine deiminase